MKRFLSFVQKEFYHVFRDKGTLLMLFGMPAALILLFGFAVSSEVKNAKIVVCDYAHDPASREIIGRLSASPVFQLQEALLSEAEVEQVLKRDDIKLAIIFPADFYEDLLHQNQAHLQIIADGSDPNTAATLNQYAAAVIQQYQRERLQGEVPYQIVPETRMLYNPELKGAINFVPGIMALVLMLVCVLMTSVSIVREKETGTMEVLLVSPFSPFLVLLSKATPYFVLSLINLALILLLSVTLLEMPVNGSLLLLIAESSLLIVCALSLGLLISSLTDSQQAAMLISMMGMLVPTLLCTGFMFPLENMPAALQLFSNVIPAKWYYIIVKSIMIKGLGFSAIWKETLILLGITSFFLILSLRAFKIRLT